MLQIESCTIWACWASFL